MNIQHNMKTKRNYIKNVWITYKIVKTIWMKINDKSSTIMQWIWRFQYRSVYSLTSFSFRISHISSIHTQTHTHKQSMISDCLNKYIVVHVSNAELFISSCVPLFTNIQRWVLKCINKFNKSFMFQCKPSLFFLSSQK